MTELWAFAAACLKVAVGVCACGGVASCASPADPEPSLEVGTGSWRFEPVEEGGEVDLIRGAQGGWHVWVSVRAVGLESTRARLAVETQIADESREAQRTEADVPLEGPNEEGYHAHIGWQAVLNEPGCYVGELLRIHASLADQFGTTVQDECTILVGAGDSPPPECDR